MMKRVIYALLAAAIILFVLNAPYFLAQVRYYVSEPARVEVPDQKEDQRVEPNRIWIESLGITAPIIYVEESSEAKFQEGLRSGVVHYPGTANPGESGNAYLFGHSSDLVTAKGDYKTVFALLPKIETGTIINVSDKEGRLFQYKADSTSVVSPSDLSVLRQDTGKKQLTLQTSYPVGTALKRFIVIAYLEEKP